MSGMWAMSRLVVFNDPHYSVSPPQCRGSAYPVEILNKLHEVARIAVKAKADAIACTGDWFHRKGKVTFREANDLLAVLNGWRQKGLDVIGILGNHDIAGHSLDSLDTRAVGSMVYSRALQLLDRQPYEAEDLYVTGTSYFHGCDSSDEGRLKMYGAEPGPRDKVHVHLAHGTLIQKGEFFEDFTRAPDLVDLLAEHDRLPDVIVCGHLHYSEGIKLYDRPDGNGKVAVCRVGSTGRVARDDFDRTPQVLVVATSGRQFVCRAVSIGKPIQAQVEHQTKGPDPEEHRVRIQEFVRVLKEEADQWSLSDHGTLIRTVGEGLGHDEASIKKALEAVEARQ